MVLRDLLILLFILELTGPIRFVHASCNTSDSAFVTCNSVTELSDSYFNRSVEKFQNVRELFIENNYLELVMHASAFRYSTNLKRITIQRSKIRRILEGTFRDLPLEYLIIADNGIEEMYPGVFYNLPLLWGLSVKNNSLKTIPRGVFKDLPALKELYLSRNEISSIEDSALENLPALSTLNLENNKINTIIVHRVVSHPEHLEVLILHENSLSSVTGIMLEKLTNLTHLGLSSNQISTIEANVFEHTPKLRTLFLNRNKLKEVDGILPSRGLVNLRELLLDSNELMFLSSSFLFKLNSLMIISLFENPWKCACLDSIQRILKNNRVKELCRRAYSTGKRPVCVSRDATDKYCSYSYDSELKDIYMNYKKTYPVNIHYLLCRLNKI